MKPFRIENPNMGARTNIGEHLDRLAFLKRSIEESQFSIERSQAAIAWSRNAIALLNRLQEREVQRMARPVCRGFVEIGN